MSCIHSNWEGKCQHCFVGEKEEQELVDCVGYCLVEDLDDPSERCEDYDDGQSDVDLVDCSGVN